MCKKHSKRNVTVLVFFLTCLSVSHSLLKAQQLNLSIASYGNVLVNRQLQSKESDFHSTFKPYTQKAVINALPAVSSADSDLIQLKRHLYGFNQISLPVRVCIAPLLQLEYANAGTNFWNATAGFQLCSNISDNLSVYADYQHGRAYLLPYQKQFVDKYGVLPGWGRAFNSSNSDAPVEFQMWNGYVSYSPAGFINMQVGQGKNFIGDGYRSLLLSDNAANYPYFRMNTHIWKIQYTNLFTKYENLPSIAGEIQPRSKFAAYHFLSVNITKSLNIGLFEAIISQGQDSAGVKRGFDVNYLNPVIFYRPVEFSRRSPDNAMMGLTGKYKITNTVHAYGQFILDDFNFQMTRKGSGFFQDKYGFQLGLSSFDVFGIKNFYLQAEFNTVRPYTYAHKAPLENYSHENQPLAHPLGADFREALLIGSYSTKNWTINTKCIFAQYGDDNIGEHNGKDIFVSDYASNLLGFGNYITQGVKTNLWNVDARLSYRLSNTNNLAAYIGWSGRWLNSVIQRAQYSYIYVGIKTNIYNHYFDF